MIECFVVFREYPRPFNPKLYKPIISCESELFEISSNICLSKILPATEMPTEGPTVSPTTSPSSPPTKIPSLSPTSDPTSFPTFQACPYFNLVNSTNNKILAAMGQKDVATKQFVPIKQRSWEGKSSSLSFLATFVFLETKLWDQFFSHVISGTGSWT